jgi:hypothetical protein
MTDSEPSFGVVATKVVQEFPPSVDSSIATFPTEPEVYHRTVAVLAVTHVSPPTGDIKKIEPPPPEQLDAIQPSPTVQSALSSQSPPSPDCVLQVPLMQTLRQSLLLPQL